MRQITLSGGKFGGRTLTGDLGSGSHVVVIDGDEEKRYRILNGQAVYEAEEIAGDEEGSFELDPL